MDLSEEGSPLAWPRNSQKRRRRTAYQRLISNSICTTPASDAIEASTKRLRTDSGSSRVRQWDSQDLEEEEDSAVTRPHPKARKELCNWHIAPSDLAYPRSLYDGWQPPMPLVGEAKAVDSLHEIFKQLYENSDDQPDYEYFNLDNFSIYCSPIASKLRAKELISLDKLSRDGYAEFMFDGQLSVGKGSHFVKGIRFSTLTLDGYGETEMIDLGNQMCIQSRVAQRKDVWYKLGKPSAEYERFYAPFLWVARFTKHFVDYLLASERVTLDHFRHRFLIYLKNNFEGEATYHDWLGCVKLQDFRAQVAAHVEFLWKECNGLGDTTLQEHPIWGEAHPWRLKAIATQELVEKHTVVTPYAFDCFKHMYFAKLLVRREAALVVLEKMQKKKIHLRLTPCHVPQQNLAAESLLTPMSMARDSPEPLLQASAGDVLRVRPDTKTKWKRTSTTWLVYVQNVRPWRNRTLLDILWLYEAKDTTIDQEEYLFKNELFLSDNCACGKEAIDLESAIEKVDVSWYARNPYAQTGLFVRQKFRTVKEDDHYDFVALKPNDFSCRCQDSTPLFEEYQAKYAVGDAVLVKEQAHGKSRLQPAYVTGFDVARRRIALRLLQRKREADPSSNARVNELIITNAVLNIGCGDVVRKCHIRFFSQEAITAGDIVTPYDRNGAGDFYFVALGQPAQGQPNTGQTSRLPLPDENGDVAYLDGDSMLPPLRQGWDPASVHDDLKLTGMGLFCGGGTFDRGLEEGGGVKFRYAVDLAQQALHTYRANAHDPEAMHFFLGSVNDYLARALEGTQNLGDGTVIAEPGTIGMISAGSCCQGFSRLQPDKFSDSSMRNASMVASVVSYVDTYVPEYLVLENVVAMTSSVVIGKGKPDQNVFSQIIAALVGLGYQVQQFLVDAWSHSSSEQRSRVFIIASAPGLAPLSKPQSSHSHPPNGRNRNLGKSSNGLPFGNRHEYPTPFEFVDASTSVQDLPDIGDAQVQLCIPYPDHRTATSETALSRGRIAAVPTHPRGMGLMQAKIAGLLRDEPAEYCEKVTPIRKMPRSSMYGRVFPNRLFPTMVTKLSVADGLNGRCVHWDQHRVLTVMEARRALGYPDHEVLIGMPSQQMRIVGNSVNRYSALAMGLSVRESWFGQNLPREVVESNPAAPAVEYIEDGPIWVSDGEDDLQAGNMLVSDERGSNDHRVSNEHRDSIAQDVAPAQQDPPVQIDNRSAKIALQLTPDEIEEVQRDHFKAIRRILERRGTWVSAS